mgnify:CR=1 FL=1
MKHFLAPADYPTRDSLARIACLEALFVCLLINNDPRLINTSSPKIVGIRVDDDASTHDVGLSLERDHRIDKLLFDDSLLIRGEVS